LPLNPRTSDYPLSLDKNFVKLQYSISVLTPPSTRRYIVAKLMQHYFSMEFFSFILNCMTIGISSHL